VATVIGMAKIDDRGGCPGAVIPCYMHIRSGEATEERVAVIGDDARVKASRFLEGGKSTQRRRSRQVIDISPVELLAGTCLMDSVSSASVSCPSLTADPKFDPNPDEQRRTVTN
jgi:hypothetical protein